MPPTPDLAQILVAPLRAFLAACRDPEAGAALHALYAADAPLYFRQAVVPRADVPRAEFAWTLAARARVLARTGEVPRPDLVAPTLLSVRDEGDRAVAWFEAHEAVADERLTGAIGFVREADEWKVGWATLAEPAAWSYALGRAQAVADVAAADAGQLAAPRSWLDVAYYRARLAPRPALTLLPDARFSCQSSGRCCTIGFGIELPATAQAAIDAIPWEEVAPHLAGTRLARGGGTNLTLKRPDERCRFLDENRHCEVHKALGRAIFPVCTAYPVAFAPTPDGVDVTTSMACPSARAGIGVPLAARTEDLYGRLALLPLPAPEAFPIAAGLDAGWPAFRELETALLALLDRTDIPLVERLRAGDRLLDAHLGQAAEPAAPRDNLAMLIAAARDRVAPDRAQAAGPLVPPLSPALEAQLVPALRGTLFMKRYSYRYGLRPAWRVAILLALVAAALGGDRPDGAMTDGLAWELNSVFNHVVIFEALVPDEGFRAELVGCFDEPGFGAELLALVGADA